MASFAFSQTAKNTTSRTSSLKKRRGIARPQKGRFISLWTAFLPALVVILVYLPTIQYAFVSDDTLFLHDLPYYTNPSLWFQSIFKPFVLVSNYFRPLAVLTFVAELQLMGSNPAIFHVTNLLLQAVNVTLITFLARNLVEKMTGVSKSMLLWLPPVIGLMYGLHPALIESTAWISSRFDLLVTLFLLLTLLADQTLEGLLKPVMVAIFFLFACLSKEMALALVFALPFWHLANEALDRNPVPSNGQRNQTWVEKITGILHKNLKTYIALAVSGLVYLTIRFASMGYLFQAQTAGSVKIGNLLQHLLLVGKSTASYFLLVIWPFGFVSPVHFSALPVALNDMEGWSSLILVCFLMFGMVLLIRWNQVIGWLAMGGFISLIPVSNILPLDMGVTGFIADRFLSFPLAILMLATGLTLAIVIRQPQSSIEKTSTNSHKFSPTWLVFGGITLWLTACLAFIIIALPNWQNDLSLWTWAAERAPLSPYPPANLSNEYFIRGNYSSALKFGEEAVNLDPSDPYAWDNLGLALFQLKRYPEAQNAFQKAVDLENQNQLYLNNLAAALREQGDLVKAENILHQILQTAPDFPQAHLNLATVYLLQDRPDLAIGEVQQAQLTLPADQADATQSLTSQINQPGRWLKLGDQFFQQRDFSGALGAYQKAAQLGAPIADVTKGLTSSLIQLKQWDQAQNLLNQAILANVKDAEIYNNLGLVAQAKGDFNAARGYYQEAINLAPDWELPRLNLQKLNN